MNNQREDACCQFIGYMVSNAVEIGWFYGMPEFKLSKILRGTGCIACAMGLGALPAVFKDQDCLFLLECMAG